MRLFVLLAFTLVLACERPVPKRAEAALRAPIEDVLEPARDTSIDEPLPEEWQILDPEDLPPDPVETGECSLRIRCPGADVELQLWRLDVPGSETWTRGDQLQTRVRPGVAVAGLPAGRYRVFSADFRRGSEDPPPFEVSGPFTRVSLDLPLPRTFRLRLKIFTETGHLATEAMQRAGFSSTRFRSVRSPTWVRKRSLRNGFASTGGCISGIG